MIGTTNLRTLRGSKRGTVMTSIIQSRLRATNLCTVEYALAEFNRQYSSPMRDTNARLIFTQLADRGAARRLAPGVYAAPGKRDGDVLPLVEAVSPAALCVFEAIDKSHPYSVDTRTIPDTVKSMFGVALQMPQVYAALKLLERQGIMRWTHGEATSARRVVGCSEFLGGGRPLDILRRAHTHAMPPLQQPTATELDSIKALMPKRTADDDVMDPCGEDEMVDPFS